MLTFKQFRKLRSEITLNSLFLNDYRNSLNIKEKNVINFFDGYLDYEMTDFIENNPDATPSQRDNYFYELLDKNDINAMYEYYKYLTFDALPIEQEE